MPGTLLLGCLAASVLLHLLGLAAALQLPARRLPPQLTAIPIEIVIDAPRIILPPSPSAPVAVGIGAKAAPAVAAPTPLPAAAANRNARATAQAASSAPL